MAIDTPGSASRPATGDPFSLFLSAHAAAKGERKAEKRFNAGEHAWLGSTGAKEACRRLKDNSIITDADLFKLNFASIPRQDERESLQYGEIVALSGDFYETPDELFDEKPSPLPWLWESNDLSDLREIFGKELHWIEERLKDKGGDEGAPYPDANIRLAWNAKSYVELALRNIDHFGWHNQLAYVRYHRLALSLARKSNGRNDEHWRRARFTNAFADHFLTDGFAAGHIRIPRAEICDWAEKQGLDSKVAGALSKLLHDQDGHVDLHSLHAEDEPGGAANGAAAHHHHGLGLPVKNACGDRWETYCDGQLFLNRSTADPAVKHAVDAVADSVEELLLAWKRGILPSRHYSATSRVPFPDPEKPRLVEKFPADMPETDVDRLWAGVSWYAKVPWLSGLKREHLPLLFTALPELMDDFRRHVADQQHSPDAAYLDPAYVRAFTKVA